MCGVELRQRMGRDDIQSLPVNSLKQIAKMCSCYAKKNSDKTSVSLKPTCSLKITWKEISYNKDMKISTACTGQSFACYCLQPQNTYYKTYKTTLKVQVKCNYYANISSTITCGIRRRHARAINSGNGNQP